MRKSYWLIMPLTLFLLFYGFYYFTAVDLSYFLDLPAMLLMLLVLLMTFCSFRPVEIVGYFSQAFKVEEREISRVESALHFFRTVQAYAFYLSGITFIMSIIYILTVAPDMSSTGPKLAVALLTIFYALLLTFFITLPFKISLQKTKCGLGAGR